MESITTLVVPPSTVILALFQVSEDLWQTVRQEQSRMMGQVQKVTQMESPRWLATDNCRIGPCPQ